MRHWGWEIHHGRDMYYAFRFGVRICANSLELLKSMIERKVTEERERRESLKEED